MVTDFGSRGPDIVGCVPGAELGGIESHPAGCDVQEGCHDDAGIGGAIDPFCPRQPSDAVSDNPAGRSAYRRGNSVQTTGTSSHRYRSLFHGPVPEVIVAKTAAGEMNALTDWIEDCKDEGIDESDICVLPRLNTGLKDVGETLKEKGYKTVQIVPGEADNRAKTGIRLSTMHRSKGLEFAAVALVRVNEEFVPPKGLSEPGSDAAIRKSLLANEKSLIHVSATTAKRRLFVSSSGQPSELIAGLEPAQREPAE